MMKSYISIILYSIVLLTLPACEVVEKLQKFSKESEAVENQIEARIGSKPKVGVKIKNDTLTEINVYFDNLENKNTTIAKIEQVVRSSVDRHIDKQPKRLLIVINANDTP